MPASYSQRTTYPILLGIKSAKLYQLEATLSLAYREFLDPDHILYGLLSEASDVRQNETN